MKARVVDGLLAGAATMVAAWPLSTLLESPTWVRPALLLSLVVAGVGMACRALGLPGWLVLAAQLVTATLTSSWLFGRGHLWHGLPTLDTAHAAGVLITEATGTISRYVAPAPTTRGLILFVGVLLALVAVCVDYLAVTRRSPSLAGLPLLVTFLVSAANTGSSLNPVFFLAAALMWLLLLARQGSSLLRRWSTTVATPVTPVRRADDEHGAGGHARLARSLGVAALLLAVLVPVGLPQLPTRFLVAGLGRSDNGVGGLSPDGTVGFNQSLDLAADLASQSTTPILAYRTTDPSPPPLRVTVSSVYRQGQWVPAPIRVSTSPRPDVPAPTGLATSVPRHRYTATVRTNRLSAPQLAAPYPLAAADIPEPWGLDNRTQVVQVRSRPSDYQVRYWDIQPTTSMLEQAGAGSDGRLFSPEDLAVPREAADRVSGLAQRVTGTAGSPYEQAVAIQQYLRDGGGFSYSLTLAPPVRDAAGHVQQLDPLSHFLVTRQGYCVQFASAMVMMARSLGIPSRMAVGFLPGTPVDDVWTVRAADAHAWPELYLDGLGWTRFEPTPGLRSGAPPAYTAAAASPDATAGGQPLADSGTAANRGQTAKDRALERAYDAQALGVDTGATPASPAGTVHDTRPGMPLLLLALGLGLAGALVVPTAAWWRRRSQLRAARDDAERVEVQWQSLTLRLGDLGLSAPPSRTPRQLLNHYGREALLDPEPAAALDRAVQTLERARYARPDGRAMSIAPEARAVLHAVAASRRRQDRLVAVAWPRSGVVALRRGREELAARLRARLPSGLPSRIDRLRRRHP